MIGDGEKVFLDTNVLVYANVAEAPLHTVALRAIQIREQAGMELWISRQVLREYLATLSRPQTFTPPIPAATLVTQVRSFVSRFHVAEDNSQVTQQLLVLTEQVALGGKQVHDANIVATMLAHGIPSLLTHNTDDFARFSGVITVLPLESSPP